MLRLESETGLFLAHRDRKGCALWVPLGILSPHWPIAKPFANGHIARAEQV